MATYFSPAACSRAAVAAPPHRRQFGSLFSLFSKGSLCRSIELLRKHNAAVRFSTIKAAGNGGDSYLDMWQKSVDRQRKSVEFERMAENSTEGMEERGKAESEDDLERKSSEFQKLLEVPVEERDRVQRMQVIDRAAAAIAAAKALVKDKPPEVQFSGQSTIEDQQEGRRGVESEVVQSGSVNVGTPGPSFWEWAPPPENDDKSGLKPVVQASPSSGQTSKPVMERDRGPKFLSLPFEAKMLKNRANPPLPPLQSLVEVQHDGVSGATPEREQEVGVEFLTNAAEAVDALSNLEETSQQGVSPDGSRWWTETGTERRPDGVICKWTLTRGVSHDKVTEWETKYWEASDAFGYKELGSEKSGRDAMGNVWREYWRESMMQEEGIIHLEKMADKWGKNARGDEWQEQWWEHYDHSGRAEKWAHKWCSIDPQTPVDVGHAHVWHERWGEKYDGKGGSSKYTDKWAERFEGDGWAKWGDKWDEHFDPDARGVKQGETWWEGKYGERWNRTWGEGHNGSGWVHKYGKSSSGEHWDTHVPQDTWYEKFPHYDFYHCLDNSVQLRDVRKPSE
ncbi:uncharacterized protein LOC127250775 [Andrographis paniculata]|uniref:uncharacterized protein LOC127250775 n=1 Tax=Andrographis paniculata TaxID=175694 RepID=UPI0021E8565B|nr:uncharacterized protein LOC127250775 [Andrographis paniculata]